MCTMTSVELVERQRQQIAEMVGDKNRYYAGLALGRNPSDEEAAWHYVTHGGPEDFDRRWNERRRRTLQSTH